MVLISTLLEIREGFSQEKYNSDKQAQRALTTMGYSSDKDFRIMVRDGMIPKCPVTPDDINNDNTIFGTGVPSLKLKMARQKPKPVVSNCINIPKDTPQLHKTALMEADIMFVNGMAFLVRISRNVRFTTVQHLGKRTTGNIYKLLEKINDD